MAKRRTGRAMGICISTIAAVAVIAGCDRRDSSASSAPTSSTASQPAPKAIPLSAEQFAAKFKEWMANGLNAPKPEESQGLFDVTGVVDRVELGISGDNLVFLRPASDTEPTEARQNRRSYIQALVNDKQPWARLARGQRATLRGRLGAFPQPPNLEQADIVDAGPSTAVMISASELAAQHANGEAGLRKLYDGKDLIVTGKVSDVRSSPLSGLTLFLVGDGKVRVRCELGVPETQRLGEAGAPKAGDTVKVFGEVQPGNLTETILPMKGCHLITK